MRIAYISTYPPRACGLATFNHNLLKAIQVNFKGQENEDTSLVIAMENSQNG